MRWGCSVVLDFIAHGNGGGGIGVLDLDGHFHRRQRCENLVQRGNGDALTAKRKTPASVCRPFVPPRQAVSARPA